MNEIYNFETKKEDYSNGVRAYRVKKGDCIYIVGNHNVKVGDKYKDCPAIVSRIDYKPKKWWQFWKKKEMVGYQIIWVGDEDEPSDDVNVIENINGFMQGEVTIEL